MPAVPAPGLVVVEAEFVLRRLERILDGPALPLDGDQRPDRGPSRAPGGEVGAFAVGEAAPDQQAACPDTGCAVPVLVCVQVGQLEVGPIGEPRSLRALARGQAPPGSGLETLR